MSFRYLALRLTVPVAGLAATGVLAVLFQLEPQYYYGVLTFIGLEPFRYPFMDLENVLSWVDCWQRGFDVYVTNPCDVEGRTLDYSPLWLRLTFLAHTEWTNPLGLFLVVSFFLALAALPPPRSAKELLLRLIATLSPVTAFAVERGNIDLLMFVIATGAGILLLGPLRRRVAAYSMIVIAGLLKLYPLVLMVLTLRERPRVFLWINSAAATVVLATSIYFHSEIVKMLVNVKNYAGWGGAWWFGEFFGAHVLPDAITRHVDAAMHPELAVLGLVRLATFAILFLAMTAWLLGMVRWRDLLIGLSRLPDFEKTFLLIGAALIVGCFFAGSNSGYRGIHLLFTLPGLSALARMEGDARVRRVAIQGCVLVVALTWVGFLTWRGHFRQILVSWVGQVLAIDVVRFLWLLSEIAWWQVTALFIAILIACLSPFLGGLRSSSVELMASTATSMRSTPVQRHSRDSAPF